MSRRRTSKKKASKVRANGEESYDYQASRP